MIYNIWLCWWRAKEFDKSNEIVTGLLKVAAAANATTERRAFGGTGACALRGITSLVTFFCALSMTVPKKEISNRGGCRNYFDHRYSYLFLSLPHGCIDFMDPYSPVVVGSGYSM